jgi:hypothetical protein
VALIDAVASGGQAHSWSRSDCTMTQSRLGARVLRPVGDTAL